jgi:hypothetical protein
MKLTRQHFLGILVAVSFALGGTLVRKKGWFIGKREFPIPEEKKSRYATPFFKDITDKSGIDHANVRPRVDEMLYNRLDSFFVAPGAAVGDWNDDGWPDIFFPATSPETPNLLYLNQKDKTFKEVSADWGIRENPSGKLAAITATTFDANADGRDDLLLTGMGCTHLWLNTGTRFTNATANSGLADCKNALAGIPFDFNADGKMDLLMLRYWGPHDMFNLKTPYIYVNNLYNASNGGSNNIYISNGDGTFRDETVARNGGDKYWSYDAVFADFDLDGVVDLYIANDYGPDQLYEVRDGKLVARNDKFPLPDRRYGMNTSLGDLDGDQKPHIYISNAYEAPPYGLTGNFLWKIRGGDAREEGMERNVMKCGFAWGAAFVDWDVDGWVDLYVANGFVSTRTPEGKEIPRTLTGNSNLFNMLQLRTLPGEFSSDIRNWISFTKMNFLSHGQRDCLFMNQANKYMVDIAEAQGLDPNLGDNRAVAVMDMDLDGDLDMMITSRNVRTMVWENLINPPARSWIGFKLKGEGAVPRDGNGARITLEQNGQVQTRWHTGGRNGFLASSDNRVHFGLRGDGPLIIRLQWPDGRVDVWRDLEPGKYHVLERTTKLD